MTARDRKPKPATPYSKRHSETPAVMNTMPPMPPRKPEISTPAQRIALAALLFGLFRALSNVYMGFGFLTAMNIPSPVYNMMPYIISLIVLAFTSKRSRAPKAEGIPYDKGQR